MDIGFILVEVCDANPASQPSLFQLEQEYPGVSVLETSCMSQCELCARKAYVYFNGELLSAGDADHLLRQLRRKIEALGEQNGS